MDEARLGRGPMWCGPNDGGIKRGDRADTGDEQAGPTDGVSERGSGVWSGDDAGPTGHPTAAADSLGAEHRVSSGGAFDLSEEFGTPDDEPTSGANVDDLTIRDATDGSLGLTNVGNKPAEDWAADTGPTRDR